MNNPPKFIRQFYAGVSWPNIGPVAAGPAGPAGPAPTALIYVLNIVDRVIFVNNASSFIVRIPCTQHVGVKSIIGARMLYVHKAVINFSLNLFGLAFTTVL